MKRLSVLFLAVVLVGLGLGIGVGLGSKTAESLQEVVLPQAIGQSTANLRAGDPLPENIFVELAKLVNPSVVNIGVSMHQQGPRYRDPVWEMFEQFMGPGFQGPQQREAMSVGTGFVIEPDGLAITNNHVVDAADQIKVTFVSQPEKKYDADVVGRDPRTDFALIRIKGAGKLPTVKLGSSRDVQVGQWVAAFGNPYGHSFSMSKGIVSAIGRQIRELNALPFIQTDASINPGNSGGPLVNTKGEVIGVNSAIDARAQGIGFAIPIDHVKELIPQLKEKGKVVRGYIGVAIDEVNPRAKQMLKLPVDSGAIIMDVMESSPAAKGGLRTYDVVVEFGGKKVGSAQDLLDAVADTKIGSAAPVVIYREGSKKTISLTVSEPPSGPQQARRQGKQGAFAAVGFDVEDFSDKLAKDFGIPPGAPKKPIVVAVNSSGPAAQAGIRGGDMILDINRTKVNKAADVGRLLQPGSNMIRVQNGRQVSLVFLNL